MDNYKEPLYAQKVQKKINTGRQSEDLNMIKMSNVTDQL